MVIRIEHLSSWAEETVSFTWPEAPVIIADNPQPTDEESEEVAELSDETVEPTSWESSRTVNILLAILLVIGITLTIGSIIRSSKRGGKGENWDRRWEDPLAISTLEVERELKQNPVLTTEYDEVKFSKPIEAESKSEVEENIANDSVAEIGDLFD
jgi:hypothetical protein